MKDSKENAPDSRRLLDRIVHTPHVAHVVPRLQPEVLHRIVQTCGLEACGELLALATPSQLAGVFDLDLWRANQPGLDEQFDADRFGVWLEMLVESGDAVAGQIVAKMDVDLVTTALAQHARVFDRAALSPAVSTDGEDLPTTHTLEDGLSCDIGGYLVVATRTESWDAICAVLMFLAAEHPNYFHRLMRGCRRLSNSRPEVDGLDDLLTDREQVAFDLALSRERRWEKQGYVSPAQARAFLQVSRELRLGSDTTLPDSTVPRAYFRALAWTDAADANSDVNGLPGASAAEPAPDNWQDATAAVVDILLDAGVLPPRPRGLLEGSRGEAPRLAHMQRHMQFVHDSDHLAYSTRSQELAYLANTIVAGCSIQSRPFTAQEASDAAVAVCNLGLENWPPHWRPAAAHRASSEWEAGTPLPDNFLTGRDLVSVFQVGWTVLHQEVCLYAAEQLIRVLTELRCPDRETQAGLDALRREMRRSWQSGTPWSARDALDVIAILDMPAWATLLGLMDEFPVLHAGIAASQGSRMRSVSGSAFEFISENSQIESVREFMRSLPETLRP